MTFPLSKSSLQGPNLFSSVKKEDLEKFKFFFDSIPAALSCLRGPDLVFEFANEATFKIIGRRDVLGKPFAHVLPELVEQRYLNILKHVYETGDPTLIHEGKMAIYNSLTGQEEPRFFDSTISRVNDGDGKPYGVFVQTSDVTERVMTRKRTEDALAARDQFLSIASHELRTPLTGMKLQAQMIKRSIAKKGESAVDMDRVMRLITQTENGVTRMSRLVEDMLDISRIQVGRFALHREPTDLVVFLKGVMEQFSDELESAKIPLKLNLMNGASVASIDRFRIEQVVTNLVTNAIKYAPGALLSVSLETTKNGVRICFQDKGPGIAKEYRERIFERFERIQPKDEVSGMGLGLYIVRQIVQAHGGSIFAESEFNQGTRFVIELPFA